MTIQYTVYNDATGEILRTGTAMTEASANLQGSTPGTRVVLVGSDPVVDVMQVTPIGVDPNKLARTPIMVGGVQIAASKTSMLANGTDKVTISPIPAGALYQVTVPKDLGLEAVADGTVADGSLALTTTVAGLYAVTIKYGTNLDFTVSINAA